MDTSIIKNYYENYDEDSRLTKKHQQIEFLTTVKYVEKYLQKDSKILEVGAGTGRYSLHFSQKGYNVHAVELVEHNINIFKSKLTKDDNIKINQGNALDLNMYKDNTFDITLVLGPMYHMYTEETRSKVIEEATRVTKKDGIIFFAYISHDAVVVQWGLLGGNLAKGKQENMFTEDYRCKSEPKDLFAMLDIEKSIELGNKHNLKHLHTVGTDGVAPWFRERFQDIKDTEYNIWLDYHFKTCERKDLIGYSNHLLYIGKKK